MMGVINITPNSFSDGGKFQSEASVLNQIKHFKKAGVSAFDIGAESTAPFNDPITADLEWERLRPILEAVVSSKLLSKEDYLSIDTYKFEIFKKSYELIRANSKDQKIIWNDISGKLEDDVIKFLKNNDFELVISHNLCPDRTLSSNHMNYLDDSIDLAAYFLNIKTKLTTDGVIDKVYFDPCFGFSKTLEQNHELIESIAKWLDPTMRWVIGVSKKSFLQAKCSGESKEEKIKQSEDLHQELISKWSKTFNSTDIFIRLHDPAVFNDALLVK